MARPVRSAHYLVHAGDSIIYCNRNERNALRIARSEARKLAAPVKVERYTRRKGEWRMWEIEVGALENLVAWASLEGTPRLADLITAILAALAKARGRGEVPHD